ncbi:MAG: histidinol-phosphate transaminase [Coriobacteriales bacterium]|jgi:histidinol-phosphate aminotransferase|nr:histidinol-phosphate transaminase [Coriobacteriales bacterium]
MDWSKFFRTNLEQVLAYQPGLREEQIREIAQVDTIHKLSSNESPLPPFDSALAAMAAKLVELNEYPDGSAHELTQLLAWHYGVPPEQIVCGNGSNELIDNIAETCLQPGDNVVYCWPSFIVYRSSAQIAGAEYREVALRPDGVFDLDAMLAQVDEHTKIVYVCSPNNPSGGIVTAAEFERFLAALPEQVLVVVDAAYEEFIDTDTPEGAAALQSTAFFDGQRPLVALKTFSKMYALAGIRCGYGLVPEPLAEYLHKVREPFNVNTVAQAGARACLEDDAEVARRRALNAAGRARLYRCFEALGLPFYRSQANFVWVEVPTPAATFDELLQRGVIVRSFPGTHGLRVGVGDESGVDATVAAFEELFGEQ